LSTFDFKTSFRLRLAGWRPGRRILKQLKLPPSFQLFPAAEAFLTEFGGLTFRNRSGYTKLDPSEASEIIHEIKEYEKLVGRRLFPIGIVEGGDTVFILMDDRDVVYALAGWLEPIASSSRIALKYLVRVYAVNQTEQRKDLQRNDLFGKSWKLK
jgi:hypothetical protein